MPGRTEESSDTHCIVAKERTEGHAVLSRSRIVGRDDALSSNKLLHLANRSEQRVLARHWSRPKDQDWQESRRSVGT